MLFNHQYPNAAFDADTLLKEQQASQIVGLSVRTLQQRRHLGLPPKYVRLPGTRSIRYRLSDLQRYIENGLVEIRSE